MRASVVCDTLGPLGFRSEPDVRLPGEFAIYDFARSYELAYDSAVQLAVFGFPRSAGPAA